MGHSFTFELFFQPIEPSFTILLRWLIIIWELVICGREHFIFRDVLSPEAEDQAPVLWESTCWLNHNFLFQILQLCFEPLAVPVRSPTWNKRHAILAFFPPQNWYYRKNLATYNWTISFTLISSGATSTSSLDSPWRTNCCTMRSNMSQWYGCDP